MAKIVSMQVEGDDQLEYASWSPGRYPSGLCLYLDEDACEKLGIARSLKAGTQLTISGKAVVTSSTESLERDGDDKGTDVSLQIQFTDLGVNVQGVMRNAAEFLYGKGE